MTVADQNVTPEMQLGAQAVSDEAEAHTPRWLIGLVVVLGVAFLAMLAVIVIKLLNGEGPMAAKDPAPVVATSGPAGQAALSAQAVEAMGDFNVARPEGATLVSTELHGREIMLHFRTPDGTDTLIVLNRMTGQQSRVTIAP